VNDESSYIEAVKAWAAEHHLPPAALDGWLALGQADALAILAVARELRLRTGQMLNALELLEEIGVREGEGAAGILARDELRRTIRGAGSRPERASAFIDKLREIRFPQLSRIRAELESAVAAMRLPRGLAVVLPKDLSSDELMVRLTARTATEFQKLLQALIDNRERFGALIEKLGGSDEI
jgi:hypothetical protein